MKIKNIKKIAILNIFSIFRILLELFMAISIKEIFGGIFVIPTIISILFVIFYYYKEVSSNKRINRINEKAGIKGIKEKMGKIIYIYNFIYSIFVLILGCILYLEGGFSRGHSFYFINIGAIFLITEILKYYYIEKKEMPNKSRMKMTAYSILCGAIIFSMSIGGTYMIYLNSLPPPLYSQEDIENAEIAYVDVKISNTIQDTELQMYKTWHAGDDYFTLLFRQDSVSDTYFKVISDNHLMASGSVSISGEGIKDENITFRMKNREGWVYFYIYNDNETLENYANYTFKVSSHHLNYQYPDINVPTID